MLDTVFLWTWIACSGGLRQDVAMLGAEAFSAPVALASAEDAAPRVDLPDSEIRVAANGAAKRAAAGPVPDPKPATPAADTDVTARIDSAEVYYMWGNYASVVRVLQRPSPVRPREQLLLGWSLYRLGRMQESARAFEAGLELSPEHPDLVNGHAFALYRLNDLEGSEAEFRRVLATNPEREESIRGLAGVLYVSQRWGECLPVYDRLLRQHPGDGDAEHHLMKSVDGLLSSWRRSGRTPAEMVAEGWRLADAGNQRSALEIFRWVLQVDVFHPGARLGLGILGPAFGREPEARRCLDELLRENPDDTKARAALARLHLDAGRVPDAEKQVGILLAKQPKDPQALALQKELEGRIGSKAR